MTIPHHDCITLQPYGSCDVGFSFAYSPGYTAPSAFSLQTNALGAGALAAAGVQDDDAAAARFTAAGQELNALGQRNRGELEDILACPVNWLTQIHSARIIDVATEGTLDPATGQPYEADGWYLSPQYWAQRQAGSAATGHSAGPAHAAAEPHAAPTDEAFAILVADCLPLILLTEGGTAAAALHVGRVGLMKGIVERALERLAADAPGEKLLAFLGPSICGTCYEVKDPVASEVAERFPDAVHPAGPDSFTVDIPGAVVTLLHTWPSGVVVAERQPCTYESLRHFSHRRAYQAHTLPTGRQSGVIVVRERHTGEASPAISPISNTVDITSA